MRSQLALAALAALGLGLAASAADARGGVVTVKIDESTPVRLEGAASQVVVGNPSIADVTVVDRHHLMILGRGYGLTNIIVLDPVGRVVFNSEVNVSAADSGRVSVFRGADVANYACSNRCERTAMPGERSDGVYTPYSAPPKDYADRARGAAPSGGGTP